MTRGDQIAAIVGTVAIISSVIAPIITAGINKKSAYELQTVELFFQEKTAAYRALLRIISGFPQYPTDEDRCKLLTAINEARLFSSLDTDAYLGRLALVLNEPITPATLEQYATAYDDAFSSIRKELKEFSKPRLRKK